jgi:hypothetical protein
MLQLLSLLTPILGDVVKRAIPDKDQAANIEKEISFALMNNVKDLDVARAEIIKTEAASGNWLTSAWRPILMLIITAIVAMNYLIFPVLALFMDTGKVFALDLPKELWNLLTIGVGGYIVGRSGEKMVDKWKK